MNSKLFVVLAIAILAVSWMQNSGRTSRDHEGVFPSFNGGDDSLAAYFDSEDTSGLLFLDTLKDATIQDIDSAIVDSRYEAFVNYLVQSQNQGMGASFFRSENDYMMKKLDVNSLAKQLKQEVPIEVIDSILTMVDDIAARKIILIDNLLKSSKYMFEPLNYGTNDSVDGKVIRPGIKYAWGSKDYSSKYNPRIRTANTSYSSVCNLSITGLDCSGFIYQLLKQNGVKIPPVNANTMRDTSLLKKLLVNVLKSDEFSVYDMPRSSPEQIENGDLLYFFTERPDSLVVATHIGIALKANETLKLFHCSGGKNRCDYNIGPNGGVRCPEIRNYINQSTAFGILRIKPNKMR